MDLVKALRINENSHIAFVGAGGKTTAMFQLARQILSETPSRSVLVTATTHLASDQIALADHHWVVTDPSDLPEPSAELPEGIILLTGAMTETERTIGLSSPSLDKLQSIAQTANTPILVEADGSRRRPVKAPAAHEPVIPIWVDQVVVVAGLSALKAPISAEWVHRPELFAELSGSSLGDPITSDALLRVLSHPLGGLKDIPATARRCALLNQADTADRQAAAQRMADTLLKNYHAVVIASLTPEDHPNDNEQGVLATHEPVAGIVLAAGGASRMGQPKQTLLWRGEALVSHVTRLANQAGLDPIIVVTGFGSDGVQQAVKDMPAVCIHNPNWENGQSTSVIAGLQAVQKKCGAAIFLLSDQPNIPVELVRSLVEAHAQNLSSIIAPIIDGQRANPVLFDRSIFPELLMLRGDVGGRAIFSRHRVKWFPWHDPAALFDIDSPEDYERLLKSSI